MASFFVVSTKKRYLWKKNSENEDSLVIAVTLSKRVETLLLSYSAKLNCNHIFCYRFLFCLESLTFGTADKKIYIGHSIIDIAIPFPSSICPLDYFVYMKLNSCRGVCLFANIAENEDH